MFQSIVTLLIAKTHGITSASERCSFYSLKVSYARADEFYKIEDTWEGLTWKILTYMSDSISHWHSSAGGTISNCGSKASATARLRGNKRYREAASNISSAYSIDNKELRSRNIKNLQVVLIGIKNIPDQDLYPSNNLCTWTNQQIYLELVDRDHSWFWRLIEGFCLKQQRQSPTAVN